LIQSGEFLSVYRSIAESTVSLVPIPFGTMRASVVSHFALFCFRFNSVGNHYTWFHQWPFPPDHGPLCHLYIPAQPSS
jgi:hypothetical protein